MAAAVLTALGVPNLLPANSIGDDTRGIEVGQWLQRNRIVTTATVAEGGATPQIVIVADDDGSRTWFPFLPGVVDALAALDLSPMIGASFVYIDCYQLIEAPAVRAIRAARAAGVPILLNGRSRDAHTMEQPAWPARLEAGAVYEFAVIQSVTVRITNACHS